jgi:tRNA threonylcarbamoyladenosine biosynthesis protein TsaE
VARQFEFVTTSAEETRRLAATVAGALRPGDVVALTGELGAGKTCFVQGAAAALGVQERVTSPSFLLRRDYQGQLPVVHLDVYRLERLQDVVELGIDDVLGRRGVTFIEWADAMSPLLPAGYLEVELRLAPLGLQDAGASNEQEPRRITVRPRGDDWLRRVAGLSADLVRWRAEAS